jgi:hypothetical protein
MKDKIGFGFLAFGFWLLIQKSEARNERKPKTQNQRPKLIRIAFN